MTDQPTLSNRISDALSNALRDHDQTRMVLRSLVVIETLNDNGERTISVITSPDMRAWDILGLSSWANECAKNTLHNELNAPGDY